MPLTLNGTTGIAGVDGSAGTPATKGSDTDTGIVYGTNTVQIATNGLSAVTVDSAQNVGVGVTPSAWGLGKAIEVNAKGNALWSAGNADCRLTTNAYYDSAYRYGVAGYANMYECSSGSHKWWNAASGSAGAAISFTQAMTLDASGNLLVGTTSSSAVTGSGLKVLPADGGANAPRIALVTANSGAGSYSFSTYSTGAGAYRFYVNDAGTINATSTTITGISDRRLKENIVDLDVGLDALLTLKPRKFDWKAGKGKNIKGDRGWIADEFQQVFPDLIDEWLDAPPEGEEPYKAVRADLLPVVVKAIQELSAKLDAAEARIAALEAK